jgi:hypothetical protein
MYEYRNELQTWKIRHGKIECQSNAVTFKVSKLSREEKRLHGRTNNKHIGGERSFISVMCLLKLQKMYAGFNSDITIISIASLAKLLVNEMQMLILALLPQSLSFGALLTKSIAHLVIDFVKVDLLLIYPCKA